MEGQLVNFSPKQIWQVWVWAPKKWSNPYGFKFKILSEIMLVKIASKSDKQTDGREEENHGNHL